MRLILIWAGLIAGLFLVLAAGQLNRARAGGFIPYWLITENDRAVAPFQQTIDLLSAGGEVRVGLLGMPRGTRVEQGVLAVSPGGEWLFYARQNPQTLTLELWRMRLSRGGEFRAEKISQGGLISSYLHQIDAPPLRFSPDGERVLFMQSRLVDDMPTVELVLLHISSGRQQTLFAGPDFIQALRWSADGASVYLVAGADSYQLDLAGGDVEHLADIPLLPVWLPDGRVLWQGTGHAGQPFGPIYAREDGAFQELTSSIGDSYYRLEAYLPEDWLLVSVDAGTRLNTLTLYRMKPDGELLEPFYNPPSDTSHPFEYLLYVSPEGDWALVYLSDTRTIFDLYRAPLPDGAWALAVEDISRPYAEALRVTDDGWLLLVDQRLGQMPALLKMRPAGAETTVLVELPTTPPDYDLHLSPGGESALLGYRAGAARLLRVDIGSGRVTHLPDGVLKAVVAREDLDYHAGRLVVAGVVLILLSLALALAPAIRRRA
jgi:hypothetical protein